ncbi:M48 family metalloprotease [Rubrimonas cliftonensis]|uniref:Putative Zn-dependent protease n=1 Tax=Rubrimonas cliftonensis TaxID=89524 RepID=A0A1H3W6Z8_9RHOB|nr:M48 family metalloprotease [Rubrimonas cliftonensis]SDZ82132.1 Putative Zn-dependent protease [Rubrimonas cliftonensis]
MSGRIFGSSRVARAILLAAALAAPLAGCGGPAPQTAPLAPGAQPQVSPRTTQEQRLGDQTHPRILAQYGGAYGGPISDYVRTIGRRLAAVTPQANAPWTFTVLDSPVVNAFALPGGYVYVTRGLVALADDEAQLAGVVGHEIGHVTAAHSAQRQTQAAVAQAGVLAAVLGAAILGADRSVVDLLGQGAGAAAQGVVASYSRSQELEADRLGVAYIAQAGYDPAAQAGFLRAMQAQDALSAQLRGGSYDPNRVDFFASHPATAERVRAAEGAAALAGGGAGGARARNRDAFLAAIEGMVYGDSAAQGFVRGQSFIHPELRFRFDAPSGFAITNAAQQIVMQGRGGRIVFDGGRDPGGDLRAYIAEAWAAALAQQTRTGQLQFRPTSRIGGMEAAAALMPVQTQGGVALAHMTVIRSGAGRLYRFFSVVPPNNPAALAAVERGAASFRQLSAAEARAARPWRIDVVTARPGDTPASLARRMPFDRAGEARLRVLNGLAPGEPLRAGQKVKLVVE